MGANPTSAAKADTTKQKQMHTPNKVPATCSRAAHVNILWDQNRPTTTAITRNKAAFAIIHRAPAQLMLAGLELAVAAATKPLTTDRTTKPMTSSATAAPKMIRASLVSDLPRSFSTRAVIPTLVAVSVPPTKRWVSQGA